jgi:phage host-nuclease inhibitor protein Gam
MKHNPVAETNIKEMKMSETISFKDYCEQKRAVATKNGQVKIPGDIAERWNERIVEGGLIALGGAGVQEYLQRYGKNTQAPKCVSLALKAEIEKQPEMAQAFFAKACELEFGAAPVIA